MIPLSTISYEKVHEESLYDEEERDIEVVLDDAKRRAYERVLRIRLFVVLVILLLVMLVFAAILATSITVPVVLYVTQRPPPLPDYVIATDILESVEAQIALNPKEDWKYREKLAAQWIASINSYSNLIHLVREEGQTDIYQQWHMNPMPCGAPNNLLVRVREGTDTIGTTIDLKEDDDKRSRTCGRPLWPAEKYYEGSRQKCEEDLHPCFDKFTRGTSVSFPEQRNLTTCADIDEIFPFAIPSVQKHEELKKITLPPRGVSNWWRLRWKGVLGQHMHYEITFTIQYSRSQSHKCVSSGVCTIVDGEWSMRFYAEGTDKWDMDVVQDLQTLFYKMVLEYDTYEDHWDCAKRFLAGDKHVGVQLKYYPSRVK